MKRTVEQRSRRFEPKAPLPSVSVDNREAIHIYLSHWENRILRAYNDSRAAAMTGKDKRLEGVIAYQRAQLSTIRTLIENNLQRRTDA